MGGGGGGGGRPEVTARPTMFMSFLAAGSSISTGLVWTESSEGTKPRLSIKLTRQEKIIITKKEKEKTHSSNRECCTCAHVSPGRHWSTEHRTTVFDHTVVAVRISNILISTFP